MRALLSLVLVALAGAEQVFEDSHALTALWQATSSGSTDAFMSQLITNREHAQHRSNDGRGPMFWAMEFKNVDAFALLIHLEVDQNQEDIDGKKPREFFEGSEADFEEFHQDAKDKVTELGASLKAREEEFYSYQQSQADNVREAVPPAAPPTACAATLRRHSVPPDGHGTAPSRPQRALIRLRVLLAQVDDYEDEDDSAEEAAQPKKPKPVVDSIDYADDEDEDDENKDEM